MTLRHAGVRSLGIVAVALAGLGAFGDGVEAQAPTVSSLVLNSPLPGNSAWPNGGGGTKPTAGGVRYFLTETIQVKVVFSASVDVTGAPRVKLGLGTCTCYADYVSGSGSDTLVFEHEVVVGDHDTDGMSIAADALELNSGTINATSGGTAATLGLGTNAFTNDTNRRVRTTPQGSGNRGVSSLSFNSPSSGDTYVAGDTIRVSLTYNGELFARSGHIWTSMGVRLTIGANVRSMAYVNRTGSIGNPTTVNFRYVVVAADMDADGISLVGNVVTGGTMVAPFSRHVGYQAVVNDGNRKVNGSQGLPGVSAVAITSTPVVGDTYEPGDTIQATVTFDNAVDVTGTPQLALDIGSDTVQASYASGTGSADLVFRYVVASGNADTNGLSVRADALALNSGTIRTAGSTQNMQLGLGSHAISNSANHKVVGTQTAAAVSGVALTSSPASGNTYGLAETIEAEVTFNRPVDVVTTSGTPQLALGIGANQRQAPYASGSGTRTLRFRYMVVAADSDGNGITVAAGALGLNSGEIDDARSGSLAATLGLGSHALTAQAGHRVDGSVEAAPAVTGVTIASSPADGSTYKLTERIEVEVTFHLAVDVDVTGGTPQLALGIGSATRQAPYAGGTGTRTLTFRYDVAFGDSDPDGISIGASALGLNGGTIAISGGTMAAGLGLGSHAVSNAGSHLVDGDQPGVSSVTLNSPVGGDTYFAGDTIEATVTFSKAVDVTGAPQLGLRIGSNTRQASYVSGTGTAELLFRYLAASGDTDTDGLSVQADALGLNSGTIRTAGSATENAVLPIGAGRTISNSASHKVDGSGAAGVVGVAMASSPANSDTYGLGETIEVDLTFNRAVTVTGTPQLDLELGTDTVQANYVSGTSTQVLRFRHVVASSNDDANGLSVPSNALKLNSGAINRAGSAAASLALGSHALTTAQANHKVDGSVEAAPAVTGVSIASSPADGITYGRSEQIDVEVTFHLAVDVDVTGGTPQLALGIGSATRQAPYASGTGTRTLTFSYDVAASDSDPNGFSIGASALGLNGGTIAISGGTMAAGLGLGSHAISNASGHRVDGTQGPPGVTGLTLNDPVVGDTYEPGDTIKATVTFNKAVDVTGTPQVTLLIGSTNFPAAYADGTGTPSLEFVFAVPLGASDAGGISATALVLNSGTIKVANGTVDAELGLGSHAISNSADHKVTGALVAPAVSGVAVTSVPPAGATYGATERIEVSVTFNRPVDVVTTGGTPQLALTVGGNTRQAPYASGTGTRTLTFGYTVVAADSDTDGITVAAGALALNSGAINDGRSGSLAAALGLGTHALTTAQAGHLVDGTIAPASLGTGGVVIASTPEGPNSTYGLGERIEARVHFDRAVVVTGSPQLAIDITGVIRQATYAGGSGTTTLSFEYWVQGAGSGGVGSGGHDLATAGIGVVSGALTLNGGTIKNMSDGVRNAVLSLTGYTFSSDSDHKVDGSIEATPAVTGATVTSEPRGGQGYAGGEEIVLRVSFSRPVAVTGVPRLTLLVGSSRRQARYVTGSGTNTLEFRYRVGPADTDPNGFSVPADGLDLAGGTIVIAGGSAAAALDLGAHALDDLEGQTVTGGGATDPYFDLLEYEFELKENVAGPVVVGEVLATDPFDGDLRYGLGEGGEGLFEVDEWGGAVTYVGEGEDAEERSEYVLEVVATAGERSGKALVRVRVTNVNEAPAYADERLSFELTEDVAGPVVLGTAAATDRDEGDALTYVMESGDAERFEVDSATAEVRYVGPGEDFDARGPKSWELKVRATDKAGLSAAVTVAVALRDANEGPSFADSAYAFEFAENVAGPLVLGTVRATDPDASDRLTYSMASGDAERFQVDASSGQVRYVGSGEDAETSAGSWAFDVLATDGGGLSARASVTVTLLDRNEGPSFEDESYEWEFEENVVGPLVLGMVRATDPDAADTLAYRLEGAEAELFEVDTSSGEVRYAGPGEDAEAGPDGWAFEVVVADGDGLEDRVPATVLLLDVNEAPSFADSAYAFEFPENAGGPLELGRVEASDVDEGDVLTYALASGDAARFAVDATTGMVRYVGPGEDYEAGPREYALTLRVTDAGGLTAEAGATVALLDVNEGPEAVGSMAPKVLEAHGSAVEEDLGPYFRDPDGDALSYTAESSSDAVAVASVSSGRLSIAPRAIGVATVTVTATDPGGLSATQQVQVTVEASRSERARALKLALAAFGRSLGAETVEAIGGRLGVESSSALGRSHVVLGGRSVGCGATGGAAVGDESACGWKQLAHDATGLLGMQLTGPAATLLTEGRDAFGAARGAYASNMTSGFGNDPYSGPAGGQQESADQEAADGPDQLGSLTFNPVSAREMLSQSSFQLSFGGSGGNDGADRSADPNGAPAGEPPSQQASRSGWTLWGQANAGEFESSPEDGLSLEGRTRSAYVGLDYRFGSGLLLGLAGSRSTMASDFDSRINGTGTVDATLTNLYPYLHWSPRDGLGLWGLVGAGMGDADLAEAAGGAQFSADLDMRMAALGVRQELVGALALKADAFSVQIESADGADLAGVTAVAQRVRLAPELTGRWTVGGAAMHVRLEVGGRYDGGDAETGMGAEAGAAFGFAHLGTGLSVDARGRTLLAHQEEQFREWGASFAVRLQPGRDRGGLAFSLEPSWGDAASGAQALWQAQGGALGGRGQAGLGLAGAPGLDAPGWTPDRMAMELGWGVVLPGGSEVVPFGRWVREGANGYRVNAGTRWTTLGLGEPGEEGEGERRSRGLQLTLDLFGEQIADGVQPAERRIGLLGQIGFR